jgi:hypothetical protein
MRRDAGKIGHRRVGQQRQHEPGHQQEAPGVDDLAHLDTAGKAVQALASGQEQRDGDCGPDGDPGRLGKCDGTEHIGEHVADRHHQADIWKAFRVGLVDVLPVEAGQPGTQCQQPHADRHKVGRVEQIQQGAGQGEQREGADAAGALPFGAFVEFLERQAQKKPEPDQQQKTQDRRRHGRLACTRQTPA